MEYLNINTSQVEEKRNKTASKFYVAQLAARSYTVLVGPYHFCRRLSGNDSIYDEALNDKIGAINKLLELY